MVIDPSALLAILQNEPERRKFNEALETAESRSMSTASFVESSMILESRYGADGVRDLDLFISKAQIMLAPVDTEPDHRLGASGHETEMVLHDAALACFRAAFGWVMRSDTVFDAISGRPAERLSA